MKTWIILLFACSLQLHGAIFAQGGKVNVSVRNASLVEVFRHIRLTSNYTFVYDSDEIKRQPRVSLSVTEAGVEEVLDRCLENTGLSYVIDDDIVIIRAVRPARQQTRQVKLTRVGGVVTDAQGSPLPGVNVRLKESTLGTSTDANGRYAITFPERDDAVLVFSFIGTRTREVACTGQDTLDVVLEEDNLNLEDVVVTGIFSRRKEDFTGSSATFSRKELKMVGNQNALQSLRSLDPSFAIIENNQWGSDPNRLPDIEIRGKSSVIGLTEEFGADPNQPLFILDGFETTLSVINDLSMDRVESITILKDAASTAIYGSKAANGVVVVETVKPTAGRVKVSYNGNFAFNWADLSDYNLMNAEEKLAFERLAGGFGRPDADGNVPAESYYEPNYYEIYREILRGVDSYWLSDPLRVAIADKHYLFAEGGDEHTRYGAGISYGNTRGVMIGSNREVVNGNVRLMYRRGPVSVNNTLSVDNAVAEREKVAFSRFARANPYFRKYDENGEPIMRLSPVGYVSYYNPLWDMEQKSFDRTVAFAFTNQLELSWRVTPDFQARARFGIGKSAEKGDKFSSPKNTTFVGKSDAERGSYAATHNSTYNHNGDVSLTFGKLVDGKHRVNAVGGFNFSENRSSSGGYTVTGFVDDALSRPSAAMQYEAGMPTFTDPMRRSASFFINTGYSYDDRYLADANYRSDGSSVFGVNRHFANTWSVGFACNLHNEKFLSSSRVNMLKLRFSIGNPGNQNFDDYISVRVYGYDFGNANPFGPAMTVKTFANEELKWQKTIDRNYGLDFAILDGRVRVNADYFHKKTNPLLVYVGTPPSTGGSKTPRNVGKQVTRGFTLNAHYAIIRSAEVNWSWNVNARHITEKYGDMGDALKKFNLENQGRDLTRYYDGGSPNDLWAVRSLGIDPGTGREVFLSKEGRETFLYDPDDEVVVGNSRPTVEGAFGSTFRYREFSLSFNFRYRVGGQIFMETLFNKVEVIGGENLYRNQDKRALYDRWKQPGDNAKFRSIAINEEPRMSSRFVMDNNILSGESISIGYESTAHWLQRVGASGLTLRGYMNDIFRLSTVKNERGIDYPFARSVSFSAGIRF